MGQTLSEPVTAKETSSCGNSFVKVGSSCMQGWRINMEDAHTHLLAVPEDKEACFFAVFDGHGGAKVAQYAGNHLHKKIVQSESYAQGKIEDAIREGFLRIDEDMIKDEQMKDEMAGTTAVIVLIKEGKIFCGNVGDSRAIASINGLVDPLSFDHKPANESEAKRIIAAGGWVEFNRVNGNLALSRALGDFIFKRNDEKPPEEQIVTAFPDVIVKSLTTDCEFILLACDGIWDVMSNQEVVDFCRERIAAGLEPEIICEELLSRCLAPDCQMGGLGCDNMTVVLACMLQNKPWEELKRKCCRPRPATPTSADDGNQSGFVTPPPTPYDRNRSKTPPEAASMANDENAFIYASPSKQQPGADVLVDTKKKINNDDRHQPMDEIKFGESPPTSDQTVPEVIRESSSDSEPSQSPAKQGKMSRDNGVIKSADKDSNVSRASSATANEDDRSSSTFTNSSSTTSTLPPPTNAASVAAISSDSVVTNHVVVNEAPTSMKTSLTDHQAMDTTTNTDTTTKQEQHKMNVDN